MTTAGYVTHSVGRNNVGLQLVIASVWALFTVWITRKIICNTFCLKVWQQTACTARTYTAHCTRIISEGQLYVIKITMIHLKQTLLVFGPDRPTQFRFSCHRHSSYSCLTFHNCRHLWLSEQQFKYCKWNSANYTGPSPASCHRFCMQHNGRIYRF